MGMGFSGMMGGWFMFLNPFLIIDLSFKFASRPARIDRFSLVKSAGFRLFNPQ
jgi:hypothetical protein